ncbi:MAG: hypothetical protein ACLP50_31685 [Solirubrobacteraceae bacterium]
MSSGPRPLVAVLTTMCAPPVRLEIACARDVGRGVGKRGDPTDLVADVALPLAQSAVALQARRSADRVKLHKHDHRTPPDPLGELVDLALEPG